MKIENVRLFLFNKFKEQGFNSYGPRAKDPDFRIFVASKIKNILIHLLSQKLQEKDEAFFADFIADFEGAHGIIITKDGNSVTMHNENWEIHETEEQEENIVPMASPTEKPTKRKYQRRNKDDTTTSSPHLMPVINEEVLKLTAITEKLEDILDCFCLAKLSVREIAAEIYDGLKHEGVNVYSSNVEIRLNGGNLMIPNLTRDAFIAIVIKIISSKKIANAVKERIAHS